MGKKQSRDFERTDDALQSSNARIGEQLTLAGAHEGPAGTVEELAALLYEDLRRIARHELRRERAAPRLQTTDLVHEAYLRLVGRGGVVFQNRAHFFGAAARAIRRVLVDEARRRTRAKRGGGTAPVSWSEVDPPGPTPAAQPLGLDAALKRLSLIAPIPARIVTLRFFAGRSVEEVAAALQLSETTIRRHWRRARTWLRAELSRGA